MKNNGGRGSSELLSDIVAGGLCTYCGACSGGCPYIVAHNGKILRLDICARTEGQCYQYCPRTTTDMDAIYQRIFGVPYDEDKVGVGVVKDVFLARSKDSDILTKAQDGGTVTTLLLAALQEGSINGAVETKRFPDRSPQGFIARNKKDLLAGAGNSYEMSPVIEALNRAPDNPDDKLAIVGVPCQIQAMAKMKLESPRNRVNIDRIKLMVGLFCGWSLSPESFNRYLKQNFDTSRIVRYDIPHHPAHSFDVYTTEGKTEIDLEVIRPYINSACSYCCDMTSQFADVSVGSGRAMFRGWNTVVVRTPAGAKAVELAKKKGLLETQPIPLESVTHLKKAALVKVKRAIQNIVKMTGSEQDTGYLVVKPAVRRAMVKE